MIIKTLTIAAALTTALFTTAPAFADTVSDIQTCRATFEAQTNADDIHLVFEKKDGVTISKARTIIFNAIFADNAGSFQLNCQLDQNNAVTLKTKSPVIYASR